MFKFILILSALCVQKGFSLHCHTCLGNGCDQAIIPFVDCSSFQLKDIGSSVVQADSTFGCLHVEYFDDDGKLEKVQKCVDISKDSNLCKTLEESFRIQTCSVKTNLEAATETTQSSTSSTECITSASSISTSAAPGSSSTSSSTGSLADSSADSSSTDLSTTSSPTDTTPCITTVTPKSTPKPNSAFTNQISAALLLFVFLIRII